MIGGLSLTRLCINRDLRIVAEWAKPGIEKLHKLETVTSISITDQQFREAFDYGGRPSLLTKAKSFRLINDDGTWLVIVWYDGAEEHARYSSATKMWEKCVKAWCEPLRIIG